MSGADRRAGAECGSRTGSGAGAFVATGRGGNGSGANQLPHGKQFGLRQGTDQCLLGTFEGRNGSARQGLCKLGGTLARWPLCGAPRTMLSAPAASPRPGTLSRCALSQTGSTGGITAAGAATPGWPLAGKFRSDLAVAGGTAWQTERHQTDDRDVDAHQTAWP